jgi:hypothetical protein
VFQLGLLSLFLGSVVSLFIGILTIKSFLFYRICSRFENEGDYVKIDGKITKLHDESKKALQGELVTVSYPEYTASYDEQEINYISVVRRLNSKVGDEALLYRNNETGFTWAKDDMRILKKNILLRLFMIFGLVVFVVLSLIL